MPMQSISFLVPPVVGAGIGAENLRDNLNTASHIGRKKAGKPLVFFLVRCKRYWMVFLHNVTADSRSRFFLLAVIRPPSPV